MHLLLVKFGQLHKVVKFGQLHKVCLMADLGIALHSLYT